jgi:hypothetical protein
VAGVARPWALPGGVEQGTELAESVALAIYVDGGDVVQEDPNGAEDGQRDGYRHAYWIATITNAWNLTGAQAWAIAHERGHPGTPRAYQIDVDNNDLGVVVGLRGPIVASHQLGNRVIDADRECRIVCYGPGKCSGR